MFLKKTPNLGCFQKWEVTEGSWQGMIFIPLAREETFLPPLAPHLHPNQWCLLAVCGVGDANHAELFLFLPLCLSLHERIISPRRSSADFPQSPWLVLHSFHCITSSLLAGWVLKDVFYKGQVPTVICHHQLLETPRKPRNDTTSATWIGSQLAAMLFPVHTTPPFTQNLWILVSLTALSEIAINKVLSMLRFTMYIFCSGLSGAICAAFHWKETWHG